jgi:hypothetical protein
MFPLIGGQPLSEELRRYWRVDEVWFVVDTDRWGEKDNPTTPIPAAQQGWHLVQSNPCFEVWLYYHIYDEPANFSFE